MNDPFRPRVAANDPGLSRAPEPSAERSSIARAGFSRLKVEIAWIRGSIWFANRADAHAYLFKFIEVFYNRQRHQTDLGHLTLSSEC